MTLDQEISRYKYFKENIDILMFYTSLGPIE